MIDLSHCKIGRLAIHKVVSKTSEEENRFSSETVELSDDMKELMIQFFFSSLSTETLYTFSEDALLTEGSVYDLSRTLFHDEDRFLDTSRRIAELLHESSTHPKVKDGDLYVVLFEETRVEGKSRRALGLFKSEVKETYINIRETGDGFRIEKSEGFSVNKMDKGCLIFDTEEEQGYIVGLFDNTGKNRNASYWADDFLQLRPRRDSRFLTQNTMNMVKDFVTKELPRKKEISKQEQIDVINRTMDYMKEKDTFDRREYSSSVLADEDTVRDFNEFLSTRGDGLDDWDKFPISGETVKKTSRFMKKVIKLDKDFSIYVHGSTNFMRKGFDPEKALNYYQIYFTEEK